MTHRRDRYVMLQNNLKDTDRLRLPVNLAQPTQTDGGGITDIIHVGIGIARRQYLVILVTAALVIAASLIYLRVASPTYTAQVQILLANPRAQFVQQQSLLAEPPFDLNQIETQLQLVRSRATAVAVINQLKLMGGPGFTWSGLTLQSLSQRIWSWGSVWIEERCAVRQACRTIGRSPRRRRRCISEPAVRFARGVQHRH